MTKASTPIFFIISRCRSGSTLLRTILDAHPELLVAPEGMFITRLYGRYGNIKKWDEHKIDSFIMDLAKVEFFHHWKIHPPALKSLLLKNLDRLDYPLACKIVHLSYSSIFEKEKNLLLGNHNPGHASYSLVTGKSSYIPLLVELFPEAKFIFITRDYRDNYLSIKDGHFELPIISLASFRWRCIYKTVAEQIKDSPSKFITMKYEDLTASPEKTLKTICSFLSIDFHKSMESFHRKEEGVRQTYDENELMRRQSRLFQPITPEYSGKWKGRLTSSQVQQADFVVGKYARIAGYEPTSTPGTSSKIRAVLGIIIGIGASKLVMLIERLSGKKYPLRN